MIEQYTFNELIVDVLQNSGMPMSSEEIWQKAIELNLDKKIGSSGKTPWATIGARLYTNIKENQSSSTYIQVSKRPTKFTLRSLYTNPTQTELIVEQQVEKKEEIEERIKFHERDLHPLLAKYVFSDPLLIVASLGKNRTKSFGSELQVKQLLDGRSTIFIRAS